VHDPWSEYEPNLLIDSIGSNPDQTLVKQFREGLKQYWDKVDKRLATETVHRIYQDSCYDFCGLDHYLHLYRISKKSRNFAAICSLLDRGSDLMITESNEAKKLDYLEDDPQEKHQYRDWFVAKNLNYTLQDGETGVLFMGHKHKAAQIIKEMHPSINIENINGDLNHLMNIFKTLEANYQENKAQVLKNYNAVQAGKNKIVVPQREKILIQVP